MRSDGRLYYLANGTILFAEDAFEKPEGVAVYFFDARKTLVVTPLQNGRAVELQASKLCDGMFKPTFATVPISAITMITDCSEEQATKFRAALAGLIMPGKN